MTARQILVTKPVLTLRLRRTSRHNLWIAAVLLAGGCASLFALPVSAQQATGSTEPQTQAPHVIQSNVRRVIVDVVVTDSQGKPVQELQAKDFSVYEDGVQQRVLSFNSHSASSDPEFVPPKLPNSPTNWFVDLPPAPVRGPLSVVLLDLLHTDIDDQPRARQELQAFIAAKPEGSRFAIFVLTDALHLVQGFTSNRNQLAASVSNESDRLPKIFLNANNFRDYISGLGAVIDVGHFLSGFPGRKNLFWISGDFPYFPLVRDMPGLLPGATAPTALGSNPFLNDQVKETIDTLARAQVSVYPVDARGLTPSADREALNAAHMFQDAVADQTGGRAFYNDNGVPGFLADVADTGFNYYELSYSPTNAKDDQKLRHIHVELARRGYHLAYRRSYRLGALDGPLPLETKKQEEMLAMPGVIQPDDSLYIYMQHGAPVAHGVFFAAHVEQVGDNYRPTAGQVSDLAQQPAYFKGTGKNPDRLLSKLSLHTYAVDFRIPVTQFQPAPGTAPEQSTTLELALAAFDQDGEMLNATVQEADAISAAGPSEQRNVFTIREQLAVPPKAASLRFAIRDNSTGRIGATEVMLPLAPDPAQ